jgi:putative nucleotidyltransferase with HDIG domain
MTAVLIFRNAAVLTMDAAQPRATAVAVQGNRTPVTTARDAVIRLGAAQVLAISVASHARRLLQEALPAYSLSAGELWRHSVTAAAVAELLPSYCGVQIPPETFTAALLHDIGKVVIARSLDKKALDWLHQAEQQGHLTRLQAETEVLKMHHGELGGIIAQHWKLPESVAKGIVHHHTPDEGKAVICDAVYLADTVAKRIDSTGKTQAPEPELNRRVMADLGVSGDQFDRLCQAAAARSEEAAARFNAC